MGNEAFLIENLIQNEYETFNPILNIGGIFCVLISVKVMYIFIFPLSQGTVQSCQQTSIDSERNEGGYSEQ